MKKSSSNGRYSWTSSSSYTSLWPMTTKKREIQANKVIREKLGEIASNNTFKVCSTLYVLDWEGNSPNTLGRPKDCRTFYAAPRTAIRLHHLSRAPALRKTDRAKLPPSAPDTRRGKGKNFRPEASTRAQAAITDPCRGVTKRTMPRIQTPQGIR